MEVLKVSGGSGPGDRSHTSLTCVPVASLIVMIALAATCFGAEGTACAPKPAATTITYGSLTLCELEVAGSSDILRFKGSANEVVVIVGYLVCVELFDPAGNKLGPRLDCGARVDAALAQDGTYTIRVRSGAATKYAISLERVAPPSPNAIPIQFGENLAGELDPAGDVDLYAFHGDAGDSVLVTAGACIEIYDPLGRRVGGRLDCDVSAGGPMPLTGTYSIRLRSTIAAPYRVEVQCLGTCAGTSLTRSGVLSQIAAGGGWNTTIYLSNTSAQPVPLTLTLRGDDGNPINVPLSITSETGSSPSAGPAVTATIGPKATFVVQTTSATESTATGWAEVQSKIPLSGYAVFRSTQSGQPSEGTATLETNFVAGLSLLYDNTNGFSTGVALANLATETATVSSTFWDQGGNQVGSQTITIPANGHISFALEKSMPVSAGRRGIVRFQSQAGGSLAGLGLRFSPTGTFTSVPIVVPQ